MMKIFRRSCLFLGYGLKDWNYDRKRQKPRHHTKDESVQVWQARDRTKDHAPRILPYSDGEYMAKKHGRAS